MQEDRILIRIALGDDAVDSVQIQARQHLRACRVLEGKTRDEALMLLPMIYHVCARAHGFAAQQAFACALGTTISNTLMHQLLVLAEICREHARRLFIDWPMLFGKKPDPGTVLEIQRHLRRIEEFAQMMMAKPQTQTHRELQQCAQDLLTMLEPLHDEVAGAGNTRSVVTSVVEAMRGQDVANLGSSNVAAMCIHEMDASYLAEQLLRDEKGEFVAAPHLRDQLYETGPLARMRDQTSIRALSDRYGNGLLTRFCAMAQELSLLPRAMLTLLAEENSVLQQYQSVKMTSVSGLGGVEAARGFLWHRVEMQQDRIKRYQILAPTEWNFHPRGALFRGLQGLRFQAKSRLQTLVNMMTTALDPCVAVAIEVV